MVPSSEISLEICLLYIQVLVAEEEEEDKKIEDEKEGDPASEKVVSAHIRGFFFLHSANEHRFKLTFFKDRAGFEFSRTGRKMVKLVDRSSG
ncbi:hypothetical protein PG996_014071 [Apiospora saccharicola]|uniref:Uncharacterized protein n=1 Tax=Apiospora saccharicola TaxID=335842 RepID=A0ABR1THD9_9PEZI